MDHSIWERNFKRYLVFLNKNMLFVNDFVFREKIKQKAKFYLEQVNSFKQKELAFFAPPSSQKGLILFNQKSQLFLLWNFICRVLGNKNFYTQSMIQENTH